ncbi:MAG: diguanylate cyclase [Sulfurimonas sp.]|uniref:sensor domain-containing diguanylate cyclase n=1 Tax=Sulfurimonas sp. TaxID=2022749 RepID=UPI00261E0B72|nr:diguanylate cyclase [Sulfurimonas sp.]MCW8895602.1 diguanylate cyclase [Sulfurimonas sp.]MCW8954773.1 diguanylate cyclase [Sulfurimonas sp.]MCW9067152.1 diguanylate cyclase [Sulfurimonas sp.]
METSIQAKEAMSMHQKAENLILQKQKATVAIALSIANDKKLIENIENKKIPSKYYEELVKNLSESTLYKNVWIQVLDKDATSLYRSWSDKKGDNLLDIREDLLEAIKSKKITCSISVGKFNLSIKAIVPVFKNEKFIGIIEVISHFNSISKNLKKSKTDSIVVVAKKEYKKQLTNPFTKLFIDDYYVANFDAPKELMKYLEDNGIENYFNDDYKIENGYIITSHELLDIKNAPIAYLIMFKKISNISSVDLDFYVYKWFTIGIIILMSIAIIIIAVMFYIYTRDKDYYKDIIDTSKNMIIVHDKNGMKQVNRTFFKYFSMYSSLEEFKKEHNYICDFFIDEDGYLQKNIDGIEWVKAVVQNSEQHHKVKLKIGDKEYYFSVSASIVSQESNHIAIIMSNISEQEKYKNELEHLSITDSLTGIGNRRYFQQKIEEETLRAKRYVNPLSLIIFDVDHFKKVNDKYGHNVGDEVLKEYTKLVASMLRTNDIFCRIGGEEFIIILPHATKDDAKSIAEKLRVKIQESKKIIPITMSFGVVEYIKGEDSEAIFKRADQALYKAKDSGRNIVVTG